MSEESFTARFQKLKAEHGQAALLDPRRAEALLVAEVAAAWLDRIAAGGDRPPEFDAVKAQIEASLARLDPPRKTGGAT